jgi:nitric oxide-associated protein 1
MNKFDYDKEIIQKILDDPVAHVILLIDLLTIPSSIYKGWSKLLEHNNIKICVVGNKIDLLPLSHESFFNFIRECLITNCAERGIKGEKIKRFELISAKTGYNVEKLISTMFALWNRKGNV